MQPERRMQQMTEDARREAREASARATELADHTIPLLEAERDELRKRVGGRVPAPLAEAPQGTFRLRQSVTCSAGCLIEAALVTADPALAKPGGPLLISPETLAMLREEGFLS